MGRCYDRGAASAEQARRRRRSRIRTFRPSECVVFEASRARRHRSPRAPRLSARAARRSTERQRGLRRSWRSASLGACRGRAFGAGGGRVLRPTRPARLARRGVWSRSRPGVVSASPRRIGKRGGARACRRQGSGEVRWVGTSGAIDRASAIGRRARRARTGTRLRMSWCENTPLRRLHRPIAATIAAAGATDRLRRAARRRPFRSRGPRAGCGRGARSRSCRPARRGR